MPLADALVGEHRRDLDVAASWGVPAHVTILYPFVPPAQVDKHLIRRLGAAVTSVAAFTCRFTRTRWFGQDVVWLDPAPSQPFRDLTARVYRAFPQHPPYEGKYDGSIPHLTVGERRRGTMAALQAAEAAVLPGLPLTVTIDQVLLIAGTEAPDS